MQSRIVSETILNGDYLLEREYNGKLPDGSDDVCGLFVVVGFGVNKKLKKRLPDHEVKKVEEVMKDICMVEGSDKPSWLRLRRLW
jgi:hypothetical protein